MIIAPSFEHLVCVLYHILVSVKHTPGDSTVIIPPFMDEETES